MRTRRNVWLAGSALTVAALSLPALAPAPAAAQGVDARWLPWVGCWEKADGVADDPMLCVRPADGGVELMTVARGEVQESRTIRADGVQRTTGEEGCTGTEQVEFSADHTRVYQSSNLECDGRIGRESSRMWALTSPGSWVDIRAVDVDGEGASWVERYRVAPAARVAEAGLDGLTEGRAAVIESARVAASSRITADALIEAYRAVGAEAVKAWIAERGEPIRLDADRLVRLADAGVPPEVIDVAVAVSYPEKFAVGQELPASARQRGMRIPVYVDPWGYGFPYYGYPYYGSRYYGMYGYGYGYGYGLYGGYPYYGWSYRPTVIVVRPAQSDDAPRGGRMVRGRGYTRGGSDPTVGGARPSTGSVNPATRSTGSSTASPRPSGSSGSSKPRTAKPRGGGGGSGSN